MLWTEGALPFSVMLVSATLHELGHLSALRYLGYRVRRIDILPMGALIEVPEGIPDRDEFVIAVAGPLASLIAACAAMVCFAVVGSAIALFAAVVNCVLGLFNLLPVRKLDGGKALCCFLAYKNKKGGERICSAASVAATTVFVTFAAVCVILSDYNLGVIVLSAALLWQVL